MKKFGFVKDQLHFKLYNSNKIRYVTHKVHGDLEIPKHFPNNRNNMEYILKNNRKRIDYEKYMNPKGIKPIITSNFPKIPPEHEFLNEEVLLMRSVKPYDRNTVCFRTSNDLSRIEIKQYLSKLYELPVNKVNTVNRMGKIMVNSDKRTSYRKNDYKKAIVKVDFEVDPNYQKYT